MRVLPLGMMLPLASISTASSRCLLLPAASSVWQGSDKGAEMAGNEASAFQHHACCCMTSAAGKNFYCNFNCCFLDCGEVRIGDRVLLGPAVQIYPVGHHVNPAERSGTHGFEHAKPVVIGDDVWLGGGCIIMCVGTASGRGSGSKHAGQRMLGRNEKGGGRHARRNKASNCAQCHP